MVLKFGRRPVGFWVNLPAQIFSQLEIKKIIKIDRRHSLVVYTLASLPVAWHDIATDTIAISARRGGVARAKSLEGCVRLANKWASFWGSNSISFILIRSFFWRKPKMSIESALCRSFSMSFKIHQIPSCPLVPDRRCLPVLRQRHSLRNIRDRQRWWLRKTK